MHCVAIVELLSAASLIIDSPAGSKSGIGDRSRRAAEDRARERPINNAVIKVLVGVQILRRAVMPQWNHIQQTTDAEATEMLLCVLELTHEQLQWLHTKLCGHSVMIQLDAHLSAAKPDFNSITDCDSVEQYIYRATGVRQQ